MSGPSHRRDAAGRPQPPASAPSAAATAPSDPPSPSSSSGSTELRQVSARFRRELHSNPSHASASGPITAPADNVDVLAAAFDGVSASASAAVPGASGGVGGVSRGRGAAGAHRGHHGRFTRLHSRRTDVSSNLGTSTAPESSSVSILVRRTPRHGHGHVADERERVRAVSAQDADRWVIDPLSHNRRYWDMYILCLLLYVATVSVYVFSFLGVLGLSSPFFWIERAIDVSFVIDIVLSFFTAYETPSGRWETRRPLIAKHYVTHWFAPDVISTVPWDVIGLALGEAEDGPTPLLLPRYIRVLRVLKAVKLLRLFRMKQSFTWFEIRFRIRYAQVRLIRLAVSISLVAHWTACLFFFFGSISSPDSPSWITQDGLPTNKYGLYVAALYFSTKTISTVGYGDITPENTLERFYVIFLMGLGAAVFATTVSQVGSIIQDQSSAATMHRNRLDQVIDMARTRNLPEQLVFDIRRYFQHRRRLQAAEGDQELLDAMSRDLKSKVLALSFQGVLDRSLIFAECSESARDCLYPHMEKTFHNPGEVIYKSGFPSDALYSIVSGSVRVVDDQGAETVLGPRDVFGERDLVFNRPRRGTATCEDYCELAVAPASAVSEALAGQPSEALARLRAEECENLWDQVFRKADHELRLWTVAQKVQTGAQRVANRASNPAVEADETDSAPYSESDAGAEPTDSGAALGAPYNSQAELLDTRLDRTSAEDAQAASEMDRGALEQAYVNRGRQLAVLDGSLQQLRTTIATLEQQSASLVPESESVTMRDSGPS